MAVTAAQPEDPEVEQVAWDLEPLVNGDGEAGVLRQLDEALALAEAFAQRLAGKVAELDADGLQAAMHELEAIDDLAGRAGTYAGLRFSVDTTDPTRGALMQKVQERSTAIETQLLFFDLEWAAVDDAAADALLAAPGLDFCRHYLRTIRRYRPYLLSEPEEKIVTEKSVTGRGAWGRLFEEVTAAIEVTLPDAEPDAPPVALDSALSRLVLPDREVRRSDRRGGHRGARARPAHPRVHLQHAAGRQGHR